MPEELAGRAAGRGSARRWGRGAVGGGTLCRAARGGQGRDEDAAGPGLSARPRDRQRPLKEAASAPRALSATDGRAAPKARSRRETEREIERERDLS